MKPIVQKSVFEWLLVGIFSLALLGQFERLATPFGQLSWHEIGMAAFLVFLMIRVFSDKSYLAQTSGFLRKGLVGVFLLGSFFLWTLLTTYLNAYWLQSTLLATTGTAYLARFALYIFFSAGVALSVQLRLVQQKVMYRITIIWLLAMAIIGLEQYLFWPDARQLAALGWDDHLNRAFGSLLDPGFFGALMAIGAVFSIIQWKSSQKRWLWQIIYGVFLLSLSLSFSRASYVAYLAGVVALSVLWRSRRVLLFIPLLVMALVLVPKDGGGEGQNLARTNSIKARTEVAEFHTKGLSWREILIGRGWYYEPALQLHRQGVEQRAVGEALPEDSSVPKHAAAVDNSYLHIFLSTGAIGFILFSASLLWLLHQKYRSLWLALAVVVLAHAIFSTALFYSWILLALGLFWSVNLPFSDGNRKIWSFVSRIHHALQNHVRLLL